MRSAIPLLLALACPIGMCLVPMLLMRRRGQQQACHGSGGSSAGTGHASEEPGPRTTADRRAEESRA